MPLPQSLPGVSEAAQKSLRLLAVRERSSAEMRRRLSQIGCSEETIEQTLDWLREKDLLSDSRYAEAFVRDKMNRGWGSRRIEDALGKENLSLAEDASGYLEDFTEEAEYERACSCVSKKHFSSKDPRASAYRFLISKGYSVSICSRVAHEYGALIS